jgi:hypothetical protein
VTSPLSDPASNGGFFSSPEWVDSKAGNSIYRRTADGFVAIVFWQSHDYGRDYFGFIVKHPASGVMKSGGGKLRSERAARHAAEALLDRLRVERRKP